MTASEQEQTVIRGKVYVLGDNIDTDLIIPAMYLNLVPTIPEEYRKLGSYALAGLPDGYPPFVTPGADTTEFQIVIGGRNFGCGSSREHAPICLGAAGARAVVAESYARIFFRNAVATGEIYPVESVDRLCERFATGDEAELFLAESRIVKTATGESFSLKPVGAVAPVIAAGGLFAYARSVGMIPAAATPAATPGPVESCETPEIKARAPAAEKKTIRRGMPTQVIAVANQKGGVGKTTTVINMAACLGEMNKRVLVVDLDPQANSTSGLGLPRQEGTSLYQALLGQGTIEGQALPTQVRNVEVVPSELDLAGSEIEVARMDNYLHCVQNALAPLVASNRYDYIFLDCPPSLGILTMNALTAARSVIVPIQCEYYALEGLSVITQLIRQLRESQANPLIDIEGIVMTMFDGRTRLAFQVVDEVRKHFGPKVYRTVVPRTVRLSEAPSHGLPIILYDPKSNGSQAYRQLTKEFLKRNIAQSR